LLIGCSLATVLVYALTILVQIHSGQAATISGTAVIVDGDTLWVGSQEIRIHGIDAPETIQRCQLPKGTWDCSGAAIAALTAMVEGKAVRCIGHEFDQSVLGSSPPAWLGPSSSIQPSTADSRYPRGQGA
jgi:endonuclease YncB( thermonuclease family)